MLLANKTAIITGASSGIGRAAALLFAQHGARIVLNARGAAGLERVRSEVTAAGGEAVGVTGDVTDPATHDALVAACMRWGGPNIAFNNAGTVGLLAPLVEQDAGNWNAVVATNLSSAFHAARAQIPAMLDSGGGSLIFTSSFVGNSVGLPGMAAYGATKAGLLGLVKGITADYAAQGIRANALLPGGTDTAMAGSDDDKAWAASLHAMKRIASPDEVAQAALFLASDMASFVAGSALWADGGNAAVKV